MLNQNSYEVNWRYGDENFSGDQSGTEFQRFHRQGLM